MAFATVLYAWRSRPTPTVCFTERPFRCSTAGWQDQRRSLPTGTPLESCRFLHRDMDVRALGDES